MVFRTIIPAADSPYGMYDQRYNVMKYHHGLQPKGYYTIGDLGQERFKWKINTDGWNSPIEYDSIKQPGKQRIVVFGDSYIESLMVDNDEHFPYLLGQKLGPSAEVYSMGMSGASLAQYLQMSRYANQRFDPDVLIVTCVYNDFIQSIDKYASGRYFFLRLNIDDTTNIKEIPPIPRIERKFRWLKSSGTVRYFVNNKKMFRSLLKRKKPSSENQTARQDEVQQVQLMDEMVIGPKDSAALAPTWGPAKVATDYIIGKFMEENCGKRRVIFMMDAPRLNIYQRNKEQNLLLRLETILEESCRKHGAEFLSLSPYFESEYAQHKQRFDNDRDMHWNPYAHSLIADWLYNYLSIPNS